MSDTNKTVNTTNTKQKRKEEEEEEKEDKREPIILKHSSARGAFILSSSSINSSHNEFHNFVFETMRGIHSHGMMEKNVLKANMYLSLISEREKHSRHHGKCNSKCCKAFSAENIGRQFPIELPIATFSPVPAKWNMNMDLAMIVLSVWQRMDPRDRAEAWPRERVNLDDQLEWIEKFALVLSAREIAICIMSMCGYMYLQHIHGVDDLRAIATPAGKGDFDAEFIKQTRKIMRGYVIGVPGASTLTTLEVEIALNNQQLGSDSGKGGGDKMDDSKCLDMMYEMGGPVLMLECIEHLFRCIYEGLFAKIFPLFGGVGTTGTEAPTMCDLDSGKTYLHTVSGREVMLSGLAPEWVKGDYLRVTHADLKNYILNVARLNFGHQFGAHALVRTTAQTCLLLTTNQVEVITSLMTCHPAKSATAKRFRQVINQHYAAGHRYLISLPYDELVFWLVCESVYAAHVPQEQDVMDCIRAIKSIQQQVSDDSCAADLLVHTKRFFTHPRFIINTRAAVRHMNAYCMRTRSARAMGIVAAPRITSRGHYQVPCAQKFMLVPALAPSPRPNAGFRRETHGEMIVLARRMNKRNEIAPNIFGEDAFSRRAISTSMLAPIYMPGFNIWSSRGVERTHNLWALRVQ